MPNPPPPTAPIAKTRTREFVMKSQKALIDTYSWECCVNCDHYTASSQREVPDETKYSGVRVEQTGPKCMKYDVLPPPEVILIGCESYEPMIPF